MADFRVHARLSAPGGGEATIKDAYMTLPPSIGVPSIADSCYSCFDYTNGLADLVRAVASNVAASTLVQRDLTPD